MHLIHRWDTVLDTAFHVYEQCRHCGKRRIRVLIPCRSYTPVDRQWVQTGQFRDPGPAPWRFRP